MKTYFILLLAALPCCSCLRAQVWTSLKNGQWTDPTVWTVSGGSGAPPYKLTSGMTVRVNHWVNWASSFSSSLEIEAGAELSINGGTLAVDNGVSMKNYGRFLGTGGTLRQCVFVGCGTSGSTAGGTWTTEGGYTRMVNMNIEIAGDWVSTSGGRRILSNTCLKTGQNFSVSGSSSRDTIQSTTIILGLHGSGNFQFSDAQMVFDNARIWAKTSGSGSIQISSGSIEGTISVLKLNTAGSSIDVSSSVSGSASLMYYCIADPTKFQDPGNKLQGEVQDCDNTTLLTAACDGISLLQVKEEVLKTRADATPRSQLRVVENPVKNRLTLLYQSPETGALEIAVYNAQGARVYGNTAHYTGGTLSFVVPENVTRLKGVYCIVVGNLRKERLTTKAIK